MKRLLSALSASVLLVTAIILTPFAAAVNNNPTVADRVIDLSKSQLLITSDNTAMTYDTEGGILKLSAKQWYGKNKPIGAVGSKSTWCKEIGLKYEDGTLAQLESGKRYAVTLNYKLVDNNTNSSDTYHLPQIAIGYDGNGSSTSKGAFYVAAVKNHAKTDAGSSYYLTAEITGNDKPLRIGFTGVVKFEINSILLQEIDAAAENQVTVVYCDEGEYKAEFAAEGGALKTPVKDGMEFVGWYSSPDFSGERVTAAAAGAVLYAKWVAGGPKIDLSKSVLLTAGDNTAMTYDTEGEKLKLSAKQWYGKNKPIGAVGSKSTWCKEIGLRYANGALVQLENGKKYAVTLNYKLVDNNTNGSDTYHLPQIAIGYDGNGSPTSKGAFYVAAVKNHTKTDAGSSYYLTAEITGNGKPLRIGFSGVVNFEISSILLHTVDAAAENQVTVVYCDGGEYKAEFAEEGGALKTPVKDGMEFVGWYSSPDFSGEKVTAAAAGAVLYAKWAGTGDNLFIKIHDGITDSPKLVKYKKGQELEQPARTGFRFLGWYKYSGFLGRPITKAAEGIEDLYAKWEEIDPKLDTDVDLTKNSKIITTETSTDSKLTLKGAKAVFDIYAYSRKLSDSVPTEVTWFPGYNFKDSNNNWIKLEQGQTYTFETVYRVDKVAAGDNVGIQIGYGVDYQLGTNRTYVKSFEKRTKSDEGKTFAYKATYTVDSNVYTKLLFSGQGTVTVLSIKIKKIPEILVDTEFGTQTYEAYELGSKSGVLGDKNGTNVTNEKNHTAGSASNKSLKLPVNTGLSRITANTVIFLNGSPLTVREGNAYAVSFYLYSPKDMNDLVYSVNSVGDTLQGNYLKFFNQEARGKISLKANEWTKVTAYIPKLAGCAASNDMLSIAVSSYDYDGSFVYLDDVSVKQYVDSEVLVYNSNGGSAVKPQRAFAGERLGNLAEPVRSGFMFDGWYYDEALTNEAHSFDIFPADTTDLVVYAKWIAMPTEAKDFDAGTFDEEIYEGAAPYSNTLSDLDGVVYGEDYKRIGKNAAWVKFAGIYGNGTVEEDGALLLTNEQFNNVSDSTGRTAAALMNKDGTPFTVVKGQRYTIEYDYVSAGNYGLAYIQPIIFEGSIYGGLGYTTGQGLDKVSVQAADSDYQTYKQSFVAERTGIVYFTLTARADGKNVDTHVYEKVYLDNVKIKLNPNVHKVTFNTGNSVYAVRYGITGEEVVVANALNSDTPGVTFDGFYTDKEFKTRFDDKFADRDITVYIKYKTLNYETPSDFKNPIKLDFEETDILKDFYRQSKYMTSWSRETQNEWLFITGDSENSLNGSNCIKLNGFNTYWNEAKFVLYDINNPDGVMLLDKGAKYRVKIMVRCEDSYESPGDLTVCLENPKKRYLLEENPSVALVYDENGDSGNYMMFTADIEVPESLSYLPMLAIRKNANALQSLFIDTVSVEKLRDCTVTYETNGGSSVEKATVQIHEKVFDPGEPYKEGYEFLGWFTNSKFTGNRWNFDKDTVESDMTLYANWKRETVKVITEETDKEDEGEKVSNGKAPLILDPDDVKKSADNNQKADSLSDEAMPIWAIALIIAGGALLLSGLAVLLIIVIKKKKGKQVTKS